jgi:hypothetical protein
VADAWWSLLSQQLAVGDVQTEDSYACANDAMYNCAIAHHPPTSTAPHRNPA